MAQVAQVTRIHTVHNSFSVSYFDYAQHDVCALCGQDTLTLYLHQLYLTHLF